MRKHEHRQEFNNNHNNSIENSIDAKKTTTGNYRGLVHLPTISEAINSTYSEMESFLREELGHNKDNEKKSIKIKSFEGDELILMLFVLSIRKNLQNVIKIK